MAKSTPAAARIRITPGVSNSNSIAPAATPRSEIACAIRLSCILPLPVREQALGGGAALVSGTPT